MKKLLSFLAITALCACLLSAQSNKPQYMPELPANATPDDSLSGLVGSVMGNVAKFQLSRSEQPVSDRFIKGFNDAILSVSNDSDYVAGYQTATMLLANVSYEFGPQGAISFNQDLFRKNVIKALNDAVPDSTELEAYLILVEEYYESVKERKLNERASTPQAIAAKKAGEKYIAKQKTTGKYKVTESGLMYRVIKAGSGENFNLFDDIDVIYVGKLVNGTVVENSEGTKSVCPAQVTPGCSEMLQLMKPGMKVEAIIPAPLAYDRTGNDRRNIGPNETLIFEIETIGLTPEEEEVVAEVDE